MWQTSLDGAGIHVFHAVFPYCANNCSLLGRNAIVVGFVMQTDEQVDISGTAALHLPAFSTPRFSGVCGSAVLSVPLCSSVPLIDLGTASAFALC